MKFPRLGNASLHFAIAIFVVGSDEPASTGESAPAPEVLRKPIAAQGETEPAAN